MGDNGHKAGHNCFIILVFFWSMHESKNHDRGPQGQSPKDPSRQFLDMLGDYFWIFGELHFAVLEP
jgi:hypothetical protein